MGFLRYGPAARTDSAGGGRGCCGGGRVLAAIVGAILVILLIGRRRGPALPVLHGRHAVLVARANAPDLPLRACIGALDSAGPGPRWFPNLRVVEKDGTLVFAAPLLSSQASIPELNSTTPNSSPASRSFP